MLSVTLRNSGSCEQLGVVVEPDELHRERVAHVGAAHVGEAHAEAGEHRPGGEDQEQHHERQGEDPRGDSLLPPRGVDVPGCGVPARRRGRSGRGRRGSLSETGADRRGLRLHRRRPPPRRACRPWWPSRSRCRSTAATCSQVGTAGGATGVCRAARRRPAAAGRRRARRSPRRTWHGRQVADLVVEAPAGSRARLSHWTNFQAPSGCRSP